MVTKCSFRHNLIEATKQKTYLTKAFKEYALMMEMLCRPLNMEWFSHKMFISSQPVPLTGMGVLYPRLRDFSTQFNISNIRVQFQISWENCLAIFTLNLSYLYSGVNLKFFTLWSQYQGDPNKSVLFPLTNQKILFLFNK